MTDPEARLAAGGEIKVRHGLRKRAFERTSGAGKPRLKLSGPGNPNARAPKPAGVLRSRLTGSAERPESGLVPFRRRCDRKIEKRFAPPLAGLVPWVNAIPSPSVFFLCGKFRMATVRQCSHLALHRVRHEGGVFSTPVAVANAGGAHPRPRVACPAPSPGSGRSERMDRKSGR